MTPTTPIQVRGLREVCEVNGHHFVRRRGTQDWTEYEPGDNIQVPPSSSNPAPLAISLIRYAQPAADEPRHWSLYVARENQPGMEYQVTGDAEYMLYQPSKQPVDITSLEAFSDCYQLAEITTEEQEGVVKEVAEREVPPKAENRAAVTENCQGWCVRVIGRLVEKGIVPAGKVEMMRSMMDAI